MQQAQVETIEYGAAKVIALSREDFGRDVAAEATRTVRSGHAYQVGAGHASRAGIQDLACTNRA